jgi:hypothetical protein
VFRVTDAWEAVMGHPPTREQVRAMSEHPKFGQLVVFDPDRLVASANEAVAGDEIDLDAWVGAALHRALAGPPREQVGRGFTPTFSAGPTTASRPPGAQPPAQRDMRVALAIAIGVVAVVVLLLLNYRSDGTSPPPSNGQTAVVQRNGDGHTNEEVVAEVRSTYCNQGYDGFQLTVVRSQLRDANGTVVQPAGRATIVEKC